jgi:hypothetical protein
LQQGLASGEENHFREPSSALTQGYTTAFLVAAVWHIIAAGIVVVMVNTGQRQSAPTTVI